MAKAITRRLRVLRAGLGLSQMDVAAKSRMPARRYWEIENGYREATDDEKGLIAAVLRTTADEAFGESLGQVVA